MVVEGVAATRVARSWHREEAGCARDMAEASDVLTMTATRWRKVARGCARGMVEENAATTQSVIS